ncbi:glycosyltransferase [Streptomyces sp. CAU 1734]|uniref:glycosyltransferase family 4 protein n=1 Tax=Streptomyces sp. CAU 1734 TaxID=3140360 RepID=UPI003261BD0D
MKISLLIHTVYGIGGTIRTTLNLAEELAARHDVEIVSVFRHREIPLFAIDPRITVVPLVNTCAGSPENEETHPAHREPAEFFPRNEARHREYSRLTDERVRAHYAASDADVVIGTRPGLVAYAARFAPARAVVIGQEHMSHNHHRAALREELRPSLERIDALVTVSEGDAAVWRENLPLPGTRVLAIPNSVPAPVVAPSDLAGNIVVAAGRLSAEKQYEVLIRAFASVVATHPEWTLRIYGWGTVKAGLRRCIEKHRLYNSVYLMGPRSPIEPEWVKGAIAVSTSRHESFGMTLVEAMRCGLPVVSTDCDYGPREIIKDGVDGLLVPVGDTEAIAGAIRGLIDDPARRRALGSAAIENARRYDPAAIAGRYDALFAELRTGAARRAAEAAVPALARTPDPAPIPDADTGAATAAGPPARSRTTPASAPGPVPPGSGPDTGPDPGAVADCVAEEDGSLTVTLIATAPPPDGARLVCALTGPSGGKTPERSYPLTPEGTAVIPPGEDFVEGEWLCRVESADGPRRAPLLARAVDQRGSLRPAGRLDPGSGVRHLVPFRRTPGAELALRSWVRPVHAEAGDIRVSGRELILTGRLIGPAEPSGPPALLLRRGRTELAFPAGPHGENPAATPAGTPLGASAANPAGPLTGTRAFTAAVNCDLLAAHRESERDRWSLWLRYAPDRAPVRVARLLDDVVRKSDVHVYPGKLAQKRRPLLLARRVLRKLTRRPPLLVTVGFVYNKENSLLVTVADR